jgi:NAD(P)-dependent dehydrogenase (short-subunit alcohol dehydrogenase family)
MHQGGIEAVRRTGPKGPPLPRNDIPALAMIGLGALLLTSRMIRQGRCLRFRGASIIVTGGSRGLGLEISRVFAREGARLTLLARDREELEQARRELIKLGGYVMIRTCDIRSERQVREAVDFVIRERGRVDVLINNAGVIQVGPFENTDVADFEEALDVYVRAPLFFMKAVTPYMKRQGGGRIVNISSIGGLVAIPHLTAYSTAKFAETGLSDGVRAELAKHNILVTTVEPGLMRTGSAFNALFKGQVRKEFGWFAVAAALPGISTSSEQAALRIVRACRYGDPYLVISPQARFLQILNTLFPRATASGMKLAARLLPSATTAQTGARSGWESRSPVVASLLSGIGTGEVERNREDIARSK